MGSPCDFFLAKNGSKGSVLPWIEKSWPFEPQKIALKQSFESPPPPPRIGLSVDPLPPM